MSPDDFLVQVLAGIPPADPRFESALASPGFRGEVYRILPTRNEASVLRMLRHLFELEIAFRDALWHGTATDDDDDYENIYHCALLLYFGGDPAEALPIWRAMNLNMDVGSGLDDECMLGAGLDATLRYLEECDDPVCAKIAAGLHKWSSEEDLDRHLAEWERGQLEYFGRSSGWREVGMT